MEATQFFPLLSAAFAALGIPLWVAMVKPNRFYGVHTAATLADEAVWYAAPRATGRELVVVGGAALFLSAFLPEYGVSGAIYIALMVFVLVAGAALVALIALARVQRLR
jgi:uncharacterized membrane protein